MHAMIDPDTGQPYLHPGAVLAEMRRAGISRDVSQEIIEALLQRAYDESDIEEAYNVA